MENTSGQKEKEKEKIYFVKYSREEIENWSLEAQPDITVDELLSLCELDDRNFYLYLSLHFMYLHITQQVFLL